MANEVARGQITIRDAYFYEDDGVTPQYVVGGVSYVIKAFNNMIIATGIGEQDQINLARWKVTFSIPANAPITGPSDVYSLIWKAKRSDGGFNQQVDKFAVVDPIDSENSALDNGTIIAQYGMPITLSLKVPDPVIRNLSLRIIAADSNTPVITLQNITDITGNSTISPVVDGNAYRYNIIINDEKLNPINAAGSPGGMGLWYAYYNYSDSYGNDQTVINSIYIVNSTLIFIMDSMNKFINMLNNRDVISQLQITETGLVHFAVQGLMRLNATSPANYGFDFNTINYNGGMFKFWAIKCAQFEYLQALLMGEGMSAFNFSGMTVQLDQDRTGVIQNMISNLEQDLQNLTKIKSQYARAGGGSGRLGTIGLNLGPATNFSFSYGSGGNPRNTPIGNGGMPLLPFLR